MIRTIGIARVAIPVPDLDEARMAWTRLGFTLGPRMREPATGIASETILFKRGALSLSSGALEIEIDAPGLEGGEVVMRQVELPEESVALHERRQMVAPSCVLWQEVPPSLTVKEEWLTHPNSALALAGALAIVETTAGLAETWERVLGPAAVNTTDDTVTLRVGTQSIVLATADDASVMYPEAEDFAAVVRVHVADLPRAADVLSDWRIDFDEAVGRLLVPPEEATGVLLELIGPR